MGVSSKRAEYRAITALVLTIIFSAAAFIVGAFSRSFAIYSLSFHLLGTGFIWLVLVIMFHQRSLAEREKLDMTQLAQAENADTIFQASKDQESLFAVAQKRLEVLEKWFVPVFAVLIAAYQITFGIILLDKVRNALDLTINAPRLGAVFTAGIAFLSFLISRYVTGMSSEEQWRPLRAGGSYLLSVAIVSFLLAISLALAQFKILIGMTILGWAIPILLIIVGGETALNVLFDIYRPRIRGQYNRSAFDSRLLGVINEPGGIFHTFASMIDYQFGFQVSQTWFYKLLEKAVLPLILFSIVTLYSLSCIVVVEPGEQAIVEHSGRFDQNSVVGPGWHWKLPWPFEIARIIQHPEFNKLV